MGSVSLLQVVVNKGHRISWSYIMAICVAISKPTKSRLNYKFINCKSIISTSMLCVIEGGVGENNEKFIIDLNLFEESWIEIGGNKVLQMK